MTTKYTLSGTQEQIDTLAHLQASLSLAVLLQQKLAIKRKIKALKAEMHYVVEDAGYTFIEPHDLDAKLGIK